MGGFLFTGNGFGPSFTRHAEQPSPPP